MSLVLPFVVCPERLVYEDSITITIGDVNVNRPYVKGIPTPSPWCKMGRWHSLGVTGDDTLTWTVNSSTAGALDDYAIDLGRRSLRGRRSELHYQPGRNSVRIGDAFSFSVEVGAGSDGGKTRAHGLQTPRLPIP